MGRLTELLAAEGGTDGTVCSRLGVAAGVTFGLEELVLFVMTEVDGAEEVVIGSLGLLELVITLTLWEMTPP